MNLYAIKYNNYINRIVKKLDSISLYKNLGTYQSQTNISFNSADGVNTTQIVNFNPEGYDYVVCAYLDNESIEIIHSRWFITDANRLKTGQYELGLKRDVIADNLEDVLEATTFIQKGSVNSDNPLIFNNEGMTFNQIKQSETLLKDKTGVQWLVGYYAANTGDKTYTLNYNTEKAIAIGVPVESWKFYDYITNDFYGPTTKEQYTVLSDRLIIGQTRVVRANLDGSISREFMLTSNPTAVSIKSNTTNAMLSNRFLEIGSATFHNRFVEEIFSIETQADTDELMSFNGKTIVDSNGKYYKVTVSNSYNITNKSSKVIGGTNLFNLMSSYISGLYTGTPNNNTFYVRYSCPVYKVAISQIANIGTTVTIAATTYTPNNALYKIFAVPYGTINIKETVDGLDFNTNLQMAQAFAKSISTELAGSLYDMQLLPYCPVQELLDESGNIDLTGINSKYYSFILDSGNHEIGVVFSVLQPSFTFNIPLKVQINRPLITRDYLLEDRYSVKTLSALSYEDTPGNYIANAKISLAEVFSDILDIKNIEVYDINLTPGTNTTSAVSYLYKGVIYVDMTTTAANLTCYCNVSVEANVTVSIDEFINSINEDTKISNECDVYRLVSPNYQGIFEFSVAKNDGVDYFNVDCNYKPYNPYIKINPNFKNLYGTDFNDSRGLILGGNFSYGQVTAAFEQYELNNKNYQSIFNREVQSIDFNNSLARTEAKWGIATGTVQAMTGGAIAGKMSGIGASTGALIAGGASLAGGIADYSNMEKRMNEAKDYKLDMFNYQLGNIKAQPYSLTRDNMFTLNYKEFPFMEYYTCTDAEKDVFKNKLKYDGMTIMAIGKIAEYITEDITFIKGQLVRCESIGDDSHMLFTINDELNKGIYLE